MTLSAPPPTELTYRQYQGWHCCWCSASLMSGGFSAGISRGGVGAHKLDVEVYACQRCTASRRRRQRGAGDRGRRGT